MAFAQERMGRIPVVGAVPRRTANVMKMTRRVAAVLRREYSALEGAGAVALDVHGMGRPRESRADTMLSFKLNLTTFKAAAPVKAVLMM